MIIIWDGASIHKCKKVREFIQREAVGEVCVLPPYSPQLNPDELVWAETKQNKVKNAIHKTLEHLKETIKNALEELKNNQRKIQSFFHKESIQFY